MFGLGSGCGGFNVWTWIILILIVLQWFRVGGGMGVGPESNLLCNGGLFIIAIFLIGACACFKSPMGISPFGGFGMGY